MIAVRRIIHLFIIVCTVGVGTLTVTGFLGGAGYLFELTSHFRLQYGLILFPFIVGFIVFKNKTGAAVAIAFMLVNLLHVFEISVPFQTASASVDLSHEWRLLQMNVNTANRDHDAVIKIIRETDPDILALEEINVRWFHALKDVLKRYPHRELVVREDNFGIGLFSRIPAEHMSVEYYGGVEVPVVRAKIKAGDETVTLLLIHTLPPASPAGFKRRNRQLADIVQRRPGYDSKLIVIGDLNATPWSYYFKKFMNEMNLKDSRDGFGIQNTWPTTIPILRIPLDHCLVSEGIKTLDRKVGPDIGSDHFPVTVQLGF